MTVEITPGARAEVADEALAGSGDQIRLLLGGIPPERRADATAVVADVAENLAGPAAWAHAHPEGAVLSVDSKFLSVPMLRGLPDRLARAAEAAGLSGRVDRVQGPPGPGDLTRDDFTYRIVDQLVIAFQIQLPVPSPGQWLPLGRAPSQVFEILRDHLAPAIPVLCVYPLTDQLARSPDELDSLLDIVAGEHSLSLAGFRDGVEHDVNLRVDPRDSRLWARLAWSFATEGSANDGRVANHQRPRRPLTEPGVLEEFFDRAMGFADRLAPQADVVIDLARVEFSLGYGGFRPYRTVIPDLDAYKWREPTQWRDPIRLDAAPYQILTRTQWEEVADDLMVLAGTEMAGRALEIEAHDVGADQVGLRIGHPRHWLEAPDLVHDWMGEHNRPRGEAIARLVDPVLGPILRPGAPDATR